MSEPINIEVVYALRDEQWLCKQSVPAETTVTDAIRLSGILDKYPEINLAVNKVGIFGKLVKPDTLLRAKDRIEIYRPLQADPKEARKKRSHKNTKGSGIAAAII